MHRVCRPREKDIFFSFSQRPYVDDKKCIPNEYACSYKTRIYQTNTENERYYLPRSVAAFDALYTYVHVYSVCIVKLWLFGYSLGSLFKHANLTPRPAPRINEKNPDRGVHEARGWSASLSSDRFRCFVSVGPLAVITRRHPVHDAAVINASTEHRASFRLLRLFGVTAAILLLRPRRAI